MRFYFDRGGHYGYQSDIDYEAQLKQRLPGTQLGARNQAKMYTETKINLIKVH